MLLSHLSAILSQPKSQASSYLSIASLYPLWSGKMSTQSLLIATRFIQDISLASALQSAASSSSILPLDELDRSIQDSLKALSSLMQGKPMEANMHGSKSGSSFGSTVPLESSDSQASMGQNNNDSEVSVRKMQSFSRAFLGRLQKLAVMFYNFRRRVAMVRGLMKDSPGVDLTRSMSWLQVPHFNWDSTNQKMTIAALDSALTVGGSFFSSHDAVILDEQAERSLGHILQLLKDGHNVLLTGEVVCSFYLSHFLSFSFIHSVTQNIFSLFLNYILHYLFP